MLSLLQLTRLLSQFLQLRIDLLDLFLVHGRRVQVAGSQMSQRFHDDGGGQGQSVDASGAGDVDADDATIQVDQRATAFVGLKNGIVLHREDEVVAPPAERAAHLILLVAAVHHGIDLVAVPQRQWDFQLARSAPQFDGDAITWFVVGNGLL